MLSEPRAEASCGQQSWAEPWKGKEEPGEPNTALLQDSGDGSCSQECRRGCNSMDRLEADVGTAANTSNVHSPNSRAPTPSKGSLPAALGSCTFSTGLFLSFKLPLVALALTNVSQAAVCLFALAAPALGGSPLPIQGVLTRSAIFQDFGIPAANKKPCVSSSEHRRAQSMGSLSTRPEKNPICSPGVIKGNSLQIEMSTRSLHAANFSCGSTTKVLGLGLIEERWWSSADLHPLLTHRPLYSPE